MRRLLNPSSVVTRLVLAAAVSSCASARFDLSPDSQLPAWFRLPEGTARREVSVELAYYSAPWGRSATLTLFDSTGRKLKSISGSRPGYSPVRLEENAPYPMYEVVSAEGITEIVEHRRAEPVFYISDDPRVREMVLKRVSRGP